MSDGINFYIDPANGYPTPLEACQNGISTPGYVPDYESIAGKCSDYINTSTTENFQLFEKNNSVLIVVIILIFLLLLGGGYYLYSKSSSKKTE
jgi:hypothetical protein